MTYGPSGISIICEGYTPNDTTKFANLCEHVRVVMSRFVFGSEFELPVINLICYLSHGICVSREDTSFTTLLLRAFAFFSLSLSLASLEVYIYADMEMLQICQIRAKLLVRERMKKRTRRNEEDRCGFHGTVLGITLMLTDRTYSLPSGFSGHILAPTAHLLVYSHQ